MQINFPGMKINFAMVKIKLQIMKINANQLWMIQINFIKLIQIVQKQHIYICYVGCAGLSSKAFLANWANKLNSKKHSIISYKFSLKLTKHRLQLLVNDSRSKLIPLAPICIIHIHEGHIVWCIHVKEFFFASYLFSLLLSHSF